MSLGWQWFFAILSVVAFIMAAPFFLQLLFGQPRIGIIFHHDDTRKEGRLLTIHLMNLPVNDWLLKALRVSRLPALDIFLLVQIVNASTGEVIAKSFMPEISLSPYSKKDGRVSLPPSILSSNTSIARWENSTNSAVLMDTNSLIHLAEGIYRVDIEISLDGNIKIFGKPCLFHVGKTEVDMDWDKNITDKILT